MVIRDADLLASLGKSAGCTVYLSVPSVDEDAWRSLEPGTAHPLQRLRAVRQLRDAGVNAGVLMAPIVPGFTTQPSQLEATVKAIADHGAAFVGANVMFLKDGTKDHFMGFLAREYPEMVEGYGRLYAGAYAKAELHRRSERNGFRAPAEVRRRPAARRQNRGKPSRSRTVTWTEHVT